VKVSQIAEAQARVAEPRILAVSLNLRALLLRLAILPFLRTVFITITISGFH
jgi:hypothetical protein